MRCAECELYECCMRTPLGGCPSGEKVEPEKIIITPNTAPMSIYDLGRAGVGIVEAQYKQLADAASDLVDAVERYMRQECLRSELAMKKEKLKELLK